MSSLIAHTGHIVGPQKIHPQATVATLIFQAGGSGTCTIPLDGLTTLEDGLAPGKPITVYYPEDGERGKPERVEVAGVTFEHDGDGAYVQVQGTARANAPATNIVPGTEPGTSPASEVSSELDVDGIVVSGNVDVEDVDE